MKAVALFCTVMLSLSYSSVSDASTDDTETIKSIILDIRDGWLNADGAPFEKHFLDFEDARYIETGGQNEGLRDLIDHHVVPEGNHLNNFSLKFENIEVHLEGDLAWALADVSVYAELASNGRVIDKKGYETFLFRKTEEEWKVIHTHSSTRNRK